MDSELNINQTYNQLPLTQLALEYVMGQVQSDEIIQCADHLGSLLIWCIQESDRNYSPGMSQTEFLTIDTIFIFFMSN